MRTTRYRAWRFLYPVIDVPEDYAGLSLDACGRIEMVADHEAVRQAILLLLSTMPGERVMRPGYGCDLYKLIFSPNDDTTAGLAIHYVRQALRRWEPRVRILELDAGRDAADPGRLEIRLRYRLKGRREYQELNFSMDLAGE